MKMVPLLCCQLGLYLKVMRLTTKFLNISLFPPVSHLSTPQNNQFEEENPMIFLVKVRVLSGSEESTSVGKWLRLLTPIPNGLASVELKVSQWRCLTNNQNGYFVCFPFYSFFPFFPPNSYIFPPMQFKFFRPSFPSLPTITKTSFESLWAPTTTSFGDVEVFDIGEEEDDEDLALFRCDCASTCHGLYPTFFQPPPDYLFLTP